MVYIHHPFKINLFSIAGQLMNRVEYNNPHSMDGLNAVCSVSSVF